MWIRDYTREPVRVGELVFWDTMPIPTIMHQKDNSLMACLRIRGQDLYSSLDSAVVLQARKLNVVFRRLTGGWGVMTDARRHMVQTYPDLTWPDPVSRLVDQERRAFFLTPGNLYETDTVLSLVYRGPRTQQARWKALMYTNLPEEDQAEGQYRYFEEEVARLAGLLQDCCANVTRLSGTDLLTYLHGTVNPTPHQVAVPDPAAYLDTYLTYEADLRRTWVAGSVMRWPQIGTRWLRCVGVKAYPSATQPGMCEALAQLPMEYRATTRYLPLDRAKATNELRRYRKAHYGQRKSVTAVLKERTTGEESPLMEQAALDWEQEANEAQAEVQHGTVSYGYLTQTVVVWGETFQDATEKATLVETTLNNAEFVAKVERLNTMDAWVGSLPGNMVANVRKPLLHSQNLSHLIPATCPTTGVAWNAHLNGPPLLRCVGRGQTPFNLDTYDGDVGMAYIAGPIGAGKSTALATMAMAWLKYPGAEVKIFDTGQSLRCATYAMGGQWYDVAAEIKRQAGVGLRLDDRETRPWGSPWMPAPGRWQCFEMEDILKTPAMVATIMGPLLQTLKERMTGAPTLFIFDEGHLYLKHETMADGIDDYTRGLRKKNGSVLFASQSIADVDRSALGPIMNDSCMTRILLPNYHALEPQTAAIYDGWGVNAREREILAHLTPKRDYYVQSRQGKRAFTLQLGPVALAFAGASQKPDLALMDTLYTGNGVQFAREWLHAKGLHTYADMLKEDV